MALGWAVAGALLPDVALSLRGLSGAQVPGELSLGPSGGLAGIGMSLAGAAVAGLEPEFRARLDELRDEFVQRYLVHPAAHRGDVDLARLVP